MYIFANKSGQIKEIVNDKALRQANDNINHIYLYCEDLPLANITSGFVRFELPDGTISQEVFFDTDNKAKKMIPYDKKRDLRYFKDYQEYEFYDIKIPDGEDPEVINVLAQEGLVKATVRFNNDNMQIYALQIIQFYVEQSVVKATECINGDQYNYLIALFKNRYFTDQFTKIKRSPYLYEFMYNIIDYDYGKAWIKDHLVLSTGACSTLVKGKTALRAFDWNYDESVSCVIKTPRTNEFYATLGVTSGIPRFDRELLAKEQYNEEYKALPFMIVEGMNEEGLYICANIVIREDNITTDTNPGKEKICMNMLPRYLLDRCKNIDEVKYLLANDISVYANTVPELSKYELHFLIRDNSGSVVLEFVNNQVKYVDDNILTNFYLYDTIKNTDDKFFTIEDYNLDNANDPVEVNKLKLYSMGLERYNLLRDIRPNHEENLPDLFNAQLDYRRAYKTFDNPSNPFWHSEYVYEGKYDLHTTLDKYEEIENEIGIKFTNRTRDGATWHTEHYSQYDFENKKLIIMDSTEDGRKYVFHLEWEKAFDILENKIKDIKPVEFYTNPATGVETAFSAKVNGTLWNFPQPKEPIKDYEKLENLPIINDKIVIGNHSSNYYDIYTIEQVYNKDETYNKDEVYNKAETYNKTEVYNIEETYSKAEVYNKTEVYAKAEVYAKDETYDKDHLYNRDETYKKDEVYNKTETYTREEVERLISILSAHFLGTYGLANTPASYTWDALCKQYLALHPEITPSKNDYIIVYFADKNTSNFCNYNDTLDEFKFMYSFNGDVTGIIARLEDIENKYEDKNNKVEMIGVNSDNTHYPGAKAVFDFLRGSGQGVVYASCSTAAAQAVKEIALFNANQKIEDGTLLAINFTYTNSVSATVDAPVYLKIGSDNYTVKSTWSATTIATGTFIEGYGNANRTTLFRVDVTNKVLYYLFKNWDNNTTYTPQALGIGYGTCNTASELTAKVATLTNYNLINNGIVAVKFTNAITVANATLNINGKGAKPIYCFGEALKENIIGAGAIATFVYNGSQYHLISIDKSVEANNGEPADASLSTLKVNGVNYGISGGGVELYDGLVIENTFTTIEQMKQKYGSNTQWDKISDEDVLPVKWQYGKKWYLNEEFINALTEDDVGLIKTITVNGKLHRVRLIGVEHDDLADGSGKAHTTWQFADLLSDNNGFSLASYWNNVAKASDNNYDYLNSSIRKAIDGEGNGDLHWFEIRSKEYSTKYTTSALDMLPDDLRGVLLAVSKQVATSSAYGITNYNTRLFQLSYREFTTTAADDAKEEGQTYKYWKDHNLKTWRNFYQVNKNEGYATGVTYATDGNNYESGKNDNFAGVQTSLGTAMSLRSPGTNAKYSIWILEETAFTTIGKAGISPNYATSQKIYNVAPAFCLGKIGDKWYGKADWWNYCSEATNNDIGILVSVVVNGVVHKVRLIGIDHDDLVSGGKAHCTFQFADVISDSNGDGLALYNRIGYQSDYENRKFENYPLNKALGNPSTFAGSFYWVKKGQTAADTGLTNKTVLDMLPANLLSVIKPVVKTVYDNAGGYNTINSKLFVLAVCEITASVSYSYSDEGTLYDYYKKNDGVGSRIYKDVNNRGGGTIYTDTPLASTGSYKTRNYAGFNAKSDNSGGAPTYLRSYYYYFLQGDSRFIINSVGELIKREYSSESYPYDDDSISIAPAFCI